jgi:hypothetical protein
MLTAREVRPSWSFMRGHLITRALAGAVISRSFVWQEPDPITGPIPQDPRCAACRRGSGATDILKTSTSRSSSSASARISASGSFAVCTATCSFLKPNLSNRSSALSVLFGEESTWTNKSGVRHAPCAASHSGGSSEKIARTRRTNAYSASCAATVQMRFKGSSALRSSSSRS